MTPAEQNNFMALEPQIVELVKAAFATAKPAVHVLTAADLASVKAAGQFTPAVHVLNQGFEVAATRTDGRVCQLRHTWMIVGVAKSASRMLSVEVARAEAGRLATEAAAGVIGRKLAGATSALVLARSPRAFADANGCYYVPLAFNVETLFQADL